MIYLDHAAFTPVEDVARSAIDQALASNWGNPESLHAAGRRARALVEQAIVQIGEYLGCLPGELRVHVNATSALRSAVLAAASCTRGPLVGSQLDHPALVQALDDIAATGREVRWIAPAAGHATLAQWRPVLSDAGVVAISLLNHELGTHIEAEQLLPLAPHAWWVLDVVQAAAWLDLRPCMHPRAFAVVSSAKLGGPPGVAVLRVPPRFEDTGKVSAPGGMPWPALVGLGAACEHRRPRRDAALVTARRLGVRLLEGLRAAAPDLEVNAGLNWLGPILSVALPGLSARALETALDLRDIAISRTSACRQRDDDGSRVVAAAFPDEPWRALHSTRWSLGWSTGIDEIDAAVASFADVVANTRGDSGLGGSPRIERGGGS